MAYNNLNKLLVSLRNAAVAKKVDVVVNKTTLNICILNLLYERGFIIGYSIYSLYKIRVFLKYLKGHGLVEHMTIPNRHSKMFIRSYKWLYRNYFVQFRLHYFMVLSTKRGIITAENLFHKKLRMGGLVLFYIRYI